MRKLHHWRNIFRDSKVFSSLFRYALAVLLLSATVAEAAKSGLNINNGKTIYADGKNGSVACAVCHGEKALGNDALGAPRLANLGYDYIIKQLADFAADKRIAAGMGMIMNDFAKALSAQDRRDLAAYLDNLKYTAEPSDLKALAAEGHQIGKKEEGEIIVKHGINGRFPACQACHGFNGRNPNIPAINQQKYVYLVNQLKNWRDGSRANDPQVEQLGVMQTIAQELTDEEIINIAAFLTSAPRLPLNKPGDL